MNQEVIDIEGLKKLSGNDAEFVNDILKLYTERAGKDITELEQALEIEDWNTVRFVVHRMRSAAVPLGLKSMVILLKKIELGVGEASPETLKALLGEVFAMSRTAMEDAREKLDLKSV